MFGLNSKRWWDFIFVDDLKRSWNIPGFCVGACEFNWCLNETLEKCLKTLYNSPQVIISHSSSTENNYYTK